MLNPVLMFCGRQTNPVSGIIISQELRGAALPMQNRQHLSIRQHLSSISSSAYMCISSAEHAAAAGQCRTSARNQGV